MIRKIAEAVTDHPKLIIISILIIVAFLASGIPKIRIEENIKEMLPQDIPSRQTLNKLDDIFGGSDVILIAISAEPDIFNSRTLGKVKAMTDSLEMMPSFTKVTSLSTIKQIKGMEWGLEVTQFMEEVPQSSKEIEQLRERLYEDSTYLGQVVSYDGTHTAVIAVVAEDTDTNLIYKEVSELVEKFQSPESIHLSGTPVIMSIVGSKIKNDLRRLIPFVIAVVCIIMYLCFGTLTGMIIPLLAALLSTVSMIGLMGHMGKPFMVVNNIMPVVLIAVGVSYAIHIIAGFYDEILITGDKREALLRTIDHVGTPVALAGLTTIVGFATMMTAPLTILAEFGAFLAFGVFMASLITLTLVPAILTLLPVPKRKLQVVKTGLIDRFLNTISKTVPRWRKSFFFSGIILMIIFAFGLPKPQMDMNPITFFPHDSEIRQADREVNEHLGGSVNLNLLFKGNIQSPEIIEAMDDIQQFLEKFPETGSSFSLATIVKKINRVMNDDNPAFEVVPETESAIAQSLLMYSMSGSPEDFEQFVDNSYENAQVVARLKSVSTKRTSKIANAVEKYCRENFKDMEKIEITGMVVFLKDMADLIIISQIRSLLISVVLISLIAWIIYRSGVIGILAIIPVVITVFINFGLMGYFGIALSTPTAVISSIIIGIGIDFSFHFLSRYKLELQRSSTIEAIRTTIKRVGKPILYDALPTACGFLVLLTSGFLPVRYLGALIAMTMMICAMGALTILASALIITRAK
ncbi:RND family transporter [bacterium]|nr:RND family transporter [bacterium]